VDQVTGFPEMMEGRVKTLHPAIHGGLLADRAKPDHMEQLAGAGYSPIDLVAVNLYPFAQTVARPGCTLEEAIEQIDAVRRAAEERDPKAVWYAFGTARADKDLGPGILP